MQKRKSMFLLVIMFMVFVEVWSFSLHGTVDIAVGNEQEVTAQLRKILDLDEINKPEKSSLHPHVLDVYKYFSASSVSGNQLQYSEANTVRSFQSKGELTEDGHFTFHYLNIPKEEEILGAELHLFISQNAFQLQNAYDSIKIQLFEIQENESPRQLEESIISSKDFGWVVFPVTSIILDALDTPNQNAEFKVRLLDSFDREISSRITPSLQNISQPILILFTRNPKISTVSAGLRTGLQVPNAAESTSTSSNQVSHTQMKLVRKIRSTSQSDEDSCMRHTIKINFKEIGWDWIVYPESIDLGYCTGACVPRTAYALMLNMTLGKNQEIKSSLCVPTVTHPMNFMYVDEDSNLFRSSIADTIVTECGCL